MKKRIIINNSGPNEDNFIKALGKAIEISEMNNQSVSFIIPTIQNLNGVVSNVLGESNIKSFIKGKKIKINNTDFYLITEKSMRDIKTSIVFCVYLSSVCLDELNDFTDISCEIILPWTDEDIEFYKKIWEDEIEFIN